MRIPKAATFLMIGVLSCSLATYAGEEIIRDPSPDGRFSLKLSRAEEGEEFDFSIIDTASHKELASLDSIGNPYAKHCDLVWAPDSNRVAFNRDNRRGGSLTVYQLKNDAFEEMQLPDFPDCKAKNIRKVFESSLVAERWSSADTLTVTQHGDWTTENDEEGECEKTATIKFNANGKPSIQSVKSVSARELADRAKAQKLVESGSEKSEAGNRDAAIADYTRAIKLDPKNVDAYNNRGNEKQLLGDIDGAIADFNQAIEVSPKEANPYFNRGSIYILKRDWKKAIPDLQQHDALSEDDEDAPPLIWIAHVRLGEKDEGDKELAAFIAAHPDFANSWNTKVDNFLLGKVNEAELLAAIESVEPDKKSDAQCSIWFFIGEKHLLDGDKPAAADAFRKSIRTDDVTCYDYDFAKAELKDLVK